MALRKEIKFFAINNITQATERDSLYCVKAPNESTFKFVITDINGNIINLFSSATTSISSSDGSISISGTNIKDIKISTELQDLINNALQSGDPISSLLNDSGYITLDSIPTKTSDLINDGDDGLNPFITANDIPSLSEYATTSYVDTQDALKVDKIAGKGLSTNDYTTLEQTKLAGIENGAEVNNISDINVEDLTDGGQTELHTHDSRYYTETEIDGLLDDKFNNPQGDSTQYLNGAGVPTILPAIPQVDGLATIIYVDQQDALKVDKIVGKGLSTNDYTTEEKNKLFGIEVGAEVNVSADWDSTTGDSQILNKPNIPTNTSDLVNDSNFVSDASYVHTDNNYTATEQIKLASIQDGAEVNVNADWNATVGDAVILNKPSIPSISGLATVTYVDQQDALKVDKVAGYSLTKNDLTDLLKSSYDSAVSWISTNGSNLISHLTNYSNPHQVTATQVGAYTKSEVDIIANDKVDKIPGKGLSTNDYTTVEQTKLAGIQDGAEVNVNADWNATSGDALILNKPTIPSVTGFVPYTGATQNVDLGEFQIKAGQVEFDQTPTGTFGVGMVRWNDTDGTTERRLKGNNVTLQDGQEIVKRVVNKTGVDLLESAYKVVRIRTVAEGGAQGQRSAIVLAQANTNLNSNATLGVVTETIINNQEGFITLLGEVREIDTTGSLQGETWADGDQLYLSESVAGGLTKVVPSSPYYGIPVATIDYAHAVHGKFSVNIDGRLALDTTLAGDNDTAPSVTAVRTFVNSGLSLKEDSANKSTSTADSGSSVKFPVWSAIVSYFTSTQIKSILGITTLSGSNTGDNATNTQYSGLAASKEDTSNKVTTFTGNETSTVKFPVVKAIVDYFDISRIKTILGITTLSGSNTGDQDLSGLLPKTNLSGTVNYIQKSTGTQTIGDSLLYEFGSNVGIGTNNPGATLELYHSSLPSLRFNDGAAKSNISYLGGILNIGTPFSTSFSINNSEKMRLNTLGRLGINTTAPSEMLEVVGNIRATSFIKSGGTSVQFLKADGSIDSNTYALASALHNPVTLGTANGLSLSTQVLSLGLASASANGALSSTDWSTFNNKQNALTNPVTGIGTTNWIPRFTGASTLGDSLIYDNGLNIGIGVTDPIAKLEVLRDLKIRNISNSSIRLNIGWTNSNQTAYLDAYNFSTGARPDFALQPDGGNVGIGTTSPTQKLHVEGLSYFSSDMFTVNNGGIFFSGNNSYQRGIYSNASGLTFQTLGSPKVTITDSGNIGVGTTSPTSKLHTIANMAGWAGWIENQETTGTGSGLVVTGGNNAGGISLLVRKRDGTSTFAVNGNGNVGIGTTTPVSKLQVVGLREYATNALAIADGNTVGAFYHTAGVLKVVI